VVVLVDYDPKGDRVKAGAVAFNFRNANGHAITAGLGGSDCKDEKVRASGFSGKNGDEGDRPRLAAFGLTVSMLAMP